MNNSTKLAHSVIRDLIEVGVSNFVISPGSRNAPLLIALNEASEKQLIDLHVKIDERGAAFFALGIAKASNNYAAVICTSGTAAANFHPAALEALHSNSKLLIITADRPERLRKTGSNQTTNQVGIYSLIKKRGINDEYFDRFNYENYGGTPILGIRGNVIIGHGISNDIAIKNMLLHSYEVASSGLAKKIKKAFK